MLRQMEGSAAVAQTVAMCRPEVICAYPISPQTHIVEGLSAIVKAWRPHPVRVHQRRVRVRGHVGRHRRLGDRRAHLHRDRQPGPALHGRGALQRRRPGPADHHDRRQPRDRRPDQHLERPLGLDVPARLGLDPALRGVKPGSARPPHPGLPDRRAALPADHGLHGRLHPHPRLRARGHAEPGPGGRVPPLLRAAPGPRPRRPGDDRRHGRPRGVHGGQVPPARQADAGARPHPDGRRRVRAGLRPPLRRPRAHATAPRTPRPSSSHWARSSARSRTSSTSCATTASRSARWPCAASARGPRTRSARRCGNAKRVVVLEKAFAVGAGGIVGQNTRLALSGLPVVVHDVVAGLGGRPITKQSLHGLFASAIAGELEPGRLTFLDLDLGIVERELARMQGERPGPHAENILRDVGIVASNPH